MTKERKIIREHRLVYAGRTRRTKGNKIGYAYIPFRYLGSENREVKYELQHEETMVFMTKVSAVSVGHEITCSEFKDDKYGDFKWVAMAPTYVSKRAKLKSDSFEQAEKEQRAQRKEAPSVIAECVELLVDGGYCEMDWVAQSQVHNAILDQLNRAHRNYHKNNKKS